MPPERSPTGTSGVSREILPHICPTSPGSFVFYIINLCSSLTAHPLLYLGCAKIPLATLTLNVSPVEDLEIAKAIIPFTREYQGPNPLRSSDTHKLSIFLSESPAPFFLLRPILFSSSFSRIHSSALRLRKRDSFFSAILSRAASPA
ncbi:hypothetical protein Q7C36_004337 [Tachysurus vachellii]|uniref:Uncharacterized protein n=1 Tax=Tachysurus vachellii TaxID=175792 RepID=A0AA88NJQ2_TACVA|nr:hypothetical protein Q7C36_004337 [Tachysurus vachellii]